MPNDGTLCGVIPAHDLATIPNFFAFSLMGGGGGSRLSTFLEALVGGYTIMIPFLGSEQVGPTPLDVDLDGDGLEVIVATPGNAMTPPRVVECIDGNGTHIPGRMCVLDPRIADGFSSAFEMYGPYIRFVGVAP
jgi:hypothetical protein